MLNDTAADEARAVINNRQIYTANAVMGMLLGLQLPPAPGFQIVRAHKKIAAAMQTFEMSRQALMQKHSQKTPEGDNVEFDFELAPACVVDGVEIEAARTERRVAMEDQGAFDTDMDILFEQPADLENMPQIRVASLGDKVAIAPAVLLALDFLFVD